MVSFVLFAQSRQDLDSIFDRRRIYGDRLKASLKGSVMFDVFSVFIKSGRADAGNRIGDIRGRAACHAGELAYLNAHTTPQNAFRVPLGIAAVERALMIARERA